MSSVNATIDSNAGFLPRSETLLSLTFLLSLVVLIVPLPTFLLDMLLAVNMAGAVLLLLVTLNSQKPLDVSVFPSLLLLLTLFRLSLNVASTRLILLNGDAGKIVMTFGDFVVGGNLIVGAVIFAILVTIQFIVITKGATRISEVNARFTLDALPGKQMAIDAELNMGAITEQEASRRRQMLARETEFFGAMDGASKYVRGDAIAGLIILAVNLLGGVIIGSLQGQSLMSAIEMYSTLTIGDGLVSQIPALIIAISAGILVTKSSSDASLGNEIQNQFGRSYPALMTAAGMMVVIAFTPGFPKIPFFGIAAALAVFAQQARQAVKPPPPENISPSAPAPDPIPPEERSLNQFVQMDRLVIEVGISLVPLVESKTGKGLTNRIANLREELAGESGFWVPRARVRDNANLQGQQYRLMINGREVGRGEVRLGDVLVVLPEHGKLDIPGLDVAEPAFGMPARWISEQSRRRAEMLGLSIVEAAGVIIIHLREVLRRHAHELLSREDLQKMLGKLKETAPTIVEEMKTDNIKPSILHQVLVNLLQEQVSITAMEPIVEAFLQHFLTVKDVPELTERVRTSIGHLIADRFRTDQGQVRVIYLEPTLAQLFKSRVHDGMIMLKQRQLERLIEQLRNEWEVSMAKGELAAVIVDSTLRRPLRKTIFRSLPDVSVLAYSELPATSTIHPVGAIRQAEVWGNDPDSEPVMDWEPPSSRAA